ncbi:MAG: hypothetical protein PHV34_00785 [Verrucomicrobiae bacterium]|nr:hypothetical protein [Verrucomicrobiae bacterium]
MLKKQNHGVERCRRRGRGAFSVLEMLVASALLSVISVILFTTLSQVTDATAGAQSKALLYQNTRMGVEQLGRELQQAAPYIPDPPVGGHNAFVCKPDNLHFIAVIDNNKGYEEVEVHYIYDGTNALLKSVVPYDGTSGTPQWNIDLSTWMNTPGIDDQDSNGDKYFTPVLEGVKAVNFMMWTNAPPDLTNPNNFSAWNPGPANIPTYINVEIKMYDPQVIRRWGSAANAWTKLSFASPGMHTNLLRTFNILVHLPRSGQ